MFFKYVRLGKTFMKNIRAGWNFDLIKIYILDVDVYNICMYACMIRDCKRMWMAAYRGIHKPRSILCGWTSVGCIAWFCGTFKRQRSLDWNSGWLFCASKSSFHDHLFYRLEKTGSFLLPYDTYIHTYMIHTYIHVCLYKLGPIYEFILGG